MAHMQNGYLLVMLETSRKDRDITMSENHVILFTIVLTKITTICHATHKSMILDLFPNIGFYNIQGYDDIKEDER
jgi:hypothetical protein